MPAGNHSSCIHHFGLDICFDEYNYHDSLQACLIARFGQSDHFPLGIRFQSFTIGHLETLYRDPVFVSLR